MRLNDYNDDWLDNLLRKLLVSEKMYIYSCGVHGGEDLLSNDAYHHGCYRVFIRTVAETIAETMEDTMQDDVYDSTKNFN